MRRPVVLCAIVFWVALVHISVAQDTTRNGLAPCPEPGATILTSFGDEMVPISHGLAGCPTVNFVGVFGPESLISSRADMVIAVYEDLVASGLKLIPHDTALLRDFPAGFSTGKPDIVDLRFSVRTVASGDKPLVTRVSVEVEGSFKIPRPPFGLASGVVWSEDTYLDPSANQDQILRSLRTLLTDFVSKYRAVNDLDSTDAGR